MIEDDRCLSDILGLSRRVFREDCLPEARLVLVGSDSDPEDELDKGGELRSTSC